MAPPDLPAPRATDEYSVALVCLGNICRSPMADVVLSAAVAEAGLDDRVRVASCGTGGWHVGKPMDTRAAASLRAAGYDPSRHRARQFADEWHDAYDLVLAMDEDNLADIGGRSERTMLFREFDPDGTGPVPDPYYGGDAGFEEVLAMVHRTTATLVGAIDATLDRS